MTPSYLTLISLGEFLTNEWWGILPAELYKFEGATYRVRFHDLECSVYTVELVGVLPEPVCSASHALTAPGQP